MQDVMWRSRQDLERHSMAVFRWHHTLHGNGWNATEQWICGAGACEQSHEWRYEKVTEELKANQEIEKLKKRLEETKGLAKKQAKLSTGRKRIWNICTKNKKNWPVLEFVNQSETLKKWKHFFETGILHMPNPEDEPDEFWNGEKFLAYLEEKTARKDAPNAANWYAHYQLGISYLIAGRNEDARDEFARSVDLTSRCTGISWTGVSVSEIGS